MTSEDAKAYIDELNKATCSQADRDRGGEVQGVLPAEAYHQDYAELHPDEPYIAINDAPKVVICGSISELYKDAIHWLVRLSSRARRIACG
jgi:peptide-methionine (S)-S-oxide reductase